MIKDLDKGKLDCAMPLIIYDKKYGVPRLTPEERCAADTGYKNVISRLRNVFLKVAQRYNTSDYHIAVGTRCGISADLVRKIISPPSKKGHKVLTPIVLGCICVGLKLHEEECRYLFNEFGMPLVFGTSMFISITVCAIRDNDSIESYISELKEYKVPGAERLRGGA